ncbi:hypothetical protein MHYP_G00005050 [Metynnis hypsauchen]
MQKAFNLTEVPMLDRAHRSLAPVPRQGEQPRAVVARLHYSRDCANILRLAREKQRIKTYGMTLSVYPDYTARVARARAARLRITYNNQERIFSTPEEAQSYIRENISTNRSPVRD